MTPPLHEGQNPVLAYVQPQQEYIYRIDSLPLACNYTIAWPNGTVLASVQTPMQQLGCELSGWLFFLHRRGERTGGREGKRQT